MFENKVEKCSVRKSGITKKATILSLALSTFAGLGVAYANSGYEVRVIRENSDKRYYTVGLTVEQLFEKENISLHPKDIVSVDLSTEIYEDIKINIDPVEVVEFIIDEEFSIFFATNQRNITLALNEFRESMHYNFYLSEGQSPISDISNNMQIHVSTAEGDKVEYSSLALGTASKTFEAIASKNPSISVNQKNTISEQVSNMMNVSSDAYESGRGDYSVYVSVDGNWKVYKTNSVTISEFLSNNGIELSEKCEIDVKLDSKIVRDTIIHIDEAETINFVIDGQEISHKTNKNNIQDVIKELEEEQNIVLMLDENDLTNVKIDEKVQNDMTIDINTIEEKFIANQEDIAFKTNYVENDELIEGKEVLKTVGQNGTREITIRETYRKDEFLSSEVVSDIIILEPVDQVIEIGTKYVENTIKTPNGTYFIEKEILMHSTAYTADYKSTGKSEGDRGYAITASGMTAQVGVVAVDTSVIPFGTKLYIEGYGYAVAGDTGGAIKGNKVDVFLDTYEEAMAYGVKQVKVYILGEEI